MTSRDGFTLIEVALALLVLGIGMLSMLAVFPAGLSAGKNAADDNVALEFADAVFNDYQWQMDGQLAGSSFSYQSTQELIGTGTTAHYRSSERLSADTWVTVYQDIPGDFPAFSVLMKEADIGPITATTSDLKRVDLFFVRAGAAQLEAEAYQVFSRTFTFYRHPRT